MPITLSPLLIYVTNSEQYILSPIFKMKFPSSLPLLPGPTSGHSGFTLKSWFLAPTSVRQQAVFSAYCAEWNRSCMKQIEGSWCIHQVKKKILAVFQRTLPFWEWGVQGRIVNSKIFCCVLLIAIFFPYFVSIDSTLHLPVSIIPSPLFFTVIVLVYSIVLLQQW